MSSSDPRPASRRVGARRPALSVDDVHQALLERISSTSFPVGSRLPSCRALAVEIGSNPTTVDRALQRLNDAGLVRTIPRRGTFVSASERPKHDALASVTHDIDRFVARASAAGLGPDEIRTEVEAALIRAHGEPSVAFVECNPTDLEYMAGLIENATGIVVQRILLDDALGYRLDTKFDIVAAPLFHLADLTGHVSGLEAVVEINFVASAKVLRKLAMLDAEQRVVVAAPTQRGLDRMTALVRQYYPEQVEQFLIDTDDPTLLAGADVAVRSNAGELPSGVEVGQEILVEWELDAGFASTFRSRIGEVLSRRR